MTTVERLEYPVRAWLFSERRRPVPILLTGVPTVGAPTIFGRIDDPAEGFAAGHYVVGPHDVSSDDAGWRGETLLVPAPGTSPPGDATTATTTLLYRQGGHPIASSPKVPTPADLPASERDANPFGLWAVDGEGRAFVVLEVEDGLLMAPSRYGSALHPGRHRVADTAETPSGARRLQVRSVVAPDDEPASQWSVGTRRQVEQAADAPLPPVVMPDWIVALEPADGGEPVPVFVARQGDVVTVRPAGRAPADWPQDARLHLESRDGPLEPRAVVGRTVTLIAVPFRHLAPGRPRWLRRRSELGRFVGRPADPTA